MAGCPDQRRCSGGSVTFNPTNLGRAVIFRPGADHQCPPESHCSLAHLIGISPPPQFFIVAYARCIIQSTRVEAFRSYLRDKIIASLTSEWPGGFPTAPVSCNFDSDINYEPTQHAPLLRIA